MKSKDSEALKSVTDEVNKIMYGVQPVSQVLSEEPTNTEFDQELKKTQTKASKKKTPEEEAGVAKGLQQAVKVENVNVFDLPLDTMSEEDVESLKSLTQDAMQSTPLSNEQSDIVEKINVIREKYGMVPLQTLNNRNQIGEDKEKLKKISKELAGASKMHKSQSERIEKMLPDVKSVDEAHGELHGGQKKLDMNKNNKVDAEDLKMLRAKKKPAKRTVTMDKPDRLVSMKVSKEAVEYVNEVEVLPKGVTRHKAKLAQGAKYGASDYGRGGEEEQTMKKAMTRKSEPKKRGSYGARQNIVRGTKVSGKDVNESASFFDKLTMLEEAPLEAISVSLQEGRMKDMVTGHMDAGHDFDTAVKKAQADMNKIKKPKPKQMSLPLSKQKANEEIDEGALGATAGAVGGAMMAGPVGAAVGGLVGHKAQQGIKKLGKKIKAGYQAFKRPQTAEAIEYMEVKKATNEEVEQLEEGTPSKKQVKQAIGIARDKRFAKGNMTGAVKTMDKVNKGLAQHPAVSKELRKQNEDIEQIDELDTKTLRSYKSKAEDDQVDRAMDMKGNTPKAKKRAMGIDKAKGRLQMKAQLYGGRPGQSSYKEEVEYIEEKNVPTNPKLWSRAKSLAKSKFDVYPSAYANGWASKWYKSKGGSWRKG
tara:strand:- start:20374 stop:22308 length:1935 start_codon:yes stop_codon:yes gene_type:complete